MNYLLLAAIFMLGLGVGIFFARRKNGKNVGAGKGQALNKRTRVGQGNIDAVNKKRREEKEEAKQKILELFETKTEIQNDDVEALLDVSDATATNYLSELEAEGKLIQVGESGRGVSYRKK